MRWVEELPAAGDQLDPLLCAAFIIAAFTLAGCLQTLWLRSPLSTPFHIPLDGGRTVGGKRIFGDNKTWGGFVIMVPAVGAAFFFLGSLRTLLPAGWAGGLWPLTTGSYGLLGCWVGLGFMAGELPNSFCKRRVGIPPGAAPHHSLAWTVCFLIDRLDSIAGGFVAFALAAPTSVLTWVYILLIGPAIHWSFSLLLYRLGVKARPA